MVRQSRAELLKLAEPRISHLLPLDGELIQEREKKLLLPMLLLLIYMQVDGSVSGSAITNLIYHWTLIFQPLASYRRQL